MHGNSHHHRLGGRAERFRFWFMPPHGQRGGGRFAGFMGGGFGERGFGGENFRTGRKLGSDELQLVILALLEEKPCHGYELIKLLGERSDGFYNPSPGMIYPALTYLEEIGYATVEAEGAKKLYRISAEGSAFLTSNRVAADAILEQLKTIGERMANVRRAFAGEGFDEEDGGKSGEFRQARHALKQAIMSKRHASVEQVHQIAQILHRAAAEIMKIGGDA